MSKIHTDGPDCLGCDQIMMQGHPRLQGWVRGVRAKRPEVHVSECFRGPKDQHDDFLAKKSEEDWPHGKHNRCRPLDKNAPFHPEIYPSLASNATPESVAVDLFVLNDAGIGCYPMPTYRAIYNEAVEAKEPISWGGNWKSLVDGPHFELTRGTYVS